MNIIWMKLMWMFYIGCNDSGILTHWVVTIHLYEWEQYIEFLCDKLGNYMEVSVWSLLTAFDRLLLWKSWKVKSRLSTFHRSTRTWCRMFHKSAWDSSEQPYKMPQKPSPWYLLIDIKSYCIVIIYMYRCHWDILGLVDNSRGCRPDSLKGAAVAVPLLLSLSCCWRWLDGMPPVGDRNGMVFVWSWNCVVGWLVKRVNSY